MGKVYGINLIAVMIFSLALFTGWGCTKKITTTDNVISIPEKESHDTAHEVVEEIVFIQDNPISDETISTNEKTSDPNRLVLGLEDIFFEFDKDAIRTNSYSILDRNIQLLKANPAVIIIIEGHTDERGTNEYNITLSERRSRTTSRYLVARGIAPERISTIAYGEERPFCQDQTEDCYQLNRRAHFTQSE